MDVDEVKQMFRDTITLLSVPVSPDILKCGQGIASVLRKYGYPQPELEAALRLADFPTAPLISRLQRLLNRPIVLRLIARFM